MTNTPVMSLDLARDYVARWDRQQEAYVPDREAGYQLMFDVIQRLAGVPASLIDLGAGLGSLVTRALRRWPSLHAVAVELDPTLVALGRQLTEAEFGSRVHWVEADLRDADWPGQCGGSFDAVCSSTALHYLAPTAIAGLTGNIAKVSTPTGIFANLDTLTMDRHTPRLRALVNVMRDEMWRDGFADGRQTWEQWWDGLRREPGFAALFEERERRFGTRTHTDMCTWSDMADGLRAAGFSEVASVSQHLDKRLLIALK